MQETFDDVWMNVGVDVAKLMTPPRCQPGIGLRPGEEAHPAAPFLPQLFAALYDSIAAHSRAGLSVVADVGHHDAAILADCARRLAGLRAYLVGVRCPIEVVLERRAASEAGRYLTAAAAGEPVPEPVLRWQGAVHVPGIYDLEVDTSLLNPHECAEVIRARLEDDDPPRAFETLAT